VPNYKGYLIDVFEREPGRWRAKSQRRDGKMIKAFEGDRFFQSVTTSADCLSADASIELARKAIDAGGISHAS
jgi:hypothetical protein